MQNNKTRVGLAFLAFVAGLAFDAKSDELETGFVRPPDSARPHTWWHWMNGNVTKDGITADLEAMARVGIGGAQIFNAGENIPHGSIQFNSPEWMEMVKHSAKEAKRLGLEICIHNCAGWSSSGGPWNTPEHGMKMVVSSETQVHGPSKFEGKIPQPPSKLDFYRDIAVLAFRTPTGERTSMREASPTVTLSDAKPAAYAVDGKNSTTVRLGMPKPKAPQFIQMAFARPFSARMLTVKPGPGMQGCGGLIEISQGRRVCSPARHRGTVIPVRAGLGKMFPRAFHFGQRENEGVEHRGSGIVLQDRYRELGGKSLFGSRRRFEGLGRLCRQPR